MGRANQPSLEHGQGWNNVRPPLDGLPCFVERKRWGSRFQSVFCSSLTGDLGHRLSKVSFFLKKRLKPPHTTEPKGVDGKARADGAAKGAPRAGGGFAPTAAAQHTVARSWPSSGWINIGRLVIGSLFRPPPLVKSIQLITGFRFAADGSVRLCDFPRLRRQRPVGADAIKFIGGVIVRKADGAETKNGQVDVIRPAAAHEAGHRLHGIAS